MARYYVLMALAVVAGTVLVLGIWITIDVLRVRSALNDAKTQASALAEQLKVVGPGGENAIAAQLAHDIVHAREIADGRIWALGQNLPFVGTDFAVVAEATRAVEGVATGGLPALTELSTERDNGTLAVKDGRVDLGVIRHLAPILESSDQVFTAARDQFSAIDVASAHGPVRSALSGLQDQLDQAQQVIGKGAEALRLAPEMLGANGPRTYLLIVQNNAEIRSTGGIPGAYAELEVNDGTLSIKHQGEGSSTGYFHPPAVKVTQEERELYGTLPANFWVDSNFTPDFPRTAEILRAMYKIHFGRKIDGIISIDPVALARILTATGPVQVTKDIALSAENVIPVLLNGVYTRYPNDDHAQNAFFAAVTKKIFSAFVAGAGDPAALIKQLQASGQEGRVIVNATRPDEQALFADTQLAGALPIQDGATPHLGLYLNDSTAAKLEFYLRRSSTVRATHCQSGKVQTFQVSTSLQSVAPARVTDLGPGVVGDGQGAKKGHMSMVLTYYAPFGGKVTAISIDGKDRTVNFNRYRGLFLATVPIELAPGQSHTVVATIQSGPGQQKDAVFRTTPGVEITANDVAVPTAC